MFGNPFDPFAGFDPSKLDPKMREFFDKITGTGGCAKCGVKDLPLKPFPPDSQTQMCGACAMRAALDLSK